MSGISYKIDIENAELEAFLESRIAKMENLRPFYVNVGEHMLNSVEDRFDTQTAPDGSAWTPLAPATVANRLKRHGNAELTILRESGHMRSTLSKLATDDFAQVGFNVVTQSGAPLAAIHHFGASAGRGGSAKIPPRPVLGMSPQDETIIAEMAEDFLRH